MKKVAVFVLLLVSTTSQIASSVKDGLLPNGNFEQGPKASELKGTKVMSGKSIPNWEICGYVEYIKSGQKQDDMLLIVPQGAFAVRLGNGALIKQKIRVIKDMFYSLTFSASRTCAQEERLNVSVSPNNEQNDSGLFPIQTMYSSNGWDSYAWAFQADAHVIEISIHNPSVEEDAVCGPIIDSIALKTLYHPKRTRANLLKNGNFEEGPYIFPIPTSDGVIIPPEIEDDHSPLPGWIIESLKAIKHIDSEHFSVPQGKRAIELIAGKESAVAQIVKTSIGRNHVLSFVVGDANNGCEGPMMVEAFAGKNMVMVSYNSNGKGGFKAARLAFRAESTRTRITFYSTIYTIKSDNSGSLCGPVLDDVKLLSVRKLHHL
ncbi:hypothetical protein ERO13_A10G077000v2 [Gossypium hirsutum]|uniref:DUF642 domain-containing protein n=1 Tax=Gossypium hirsutum TaxID=3635 RepID=A0A1U8IQC4_GOSHI|nr:uncharacterized protein LOC107897212 [Gossypium hirsutum]KAG4178964.1 hypothetical protein ERO13_A10G077000v2 [Gossypium hirsutum]